MRAGRQKGVETRIRQKKIRQAKVISLVEGGVGIWDACKAVGVAVNTYKDWRRREPDFVARIDSVRRGLVHDKPMPIHSFADYRERYFGMQTPAFQQLMVTGYEQTPKGNILLILVPPEHGKTTLFEDWSCKKLADDPSYRFLIGSEAVTISKKIIFRVENRMEPAGPFPEWVARFGPFVPQNETGRSTGQVWGAEHFNVFKKSDQDERDYSMKALGLMSSVVSTRTDHLHMDDAQSLKTLSLTPKLVDVFRQDWLSRSGESAPVTINGTPVGEDDFYQALEEDEELGPDIMQVIKLPAIVVDSDTKVEKPLWEEKYTMEQLDRIRRKAGVDGWNRNYMMRRTVSGRNFAFTDEELLPCLAPLKSLLHRPPKDAVLLMSLDPAIGGKNCVMAFRVDEGRLEIVGLREKVGLVSNEQIMAEVEALLLDVTLNGAVVTDLVIEAKNFQAGLARDERLEAMRRLHGFRILEHLTGINKYDENIGVSSMVHSFLKKDVVIPWAGDAYTRHEMEELLHQFRRWRPFKRGNKLRQDRVMAVWFAWITWRNRAKFFEAPPDESPFRRQGLPYRVTQPGLIVPIGARL